MVPKWAIIAGFTILGLMWLATILVMNGESYRLTQSRQRNPSYPHPLAPKPNLLDGRDRTIATFPDLGSM
ncbi:MAG TPA: hypothetical protein VFA32_23525, partial [Dehalococcoidia bacterium]|nr:hypothetical protein [Dehalococcoidia bacterium]